MFACPLLAIALDWIVTDVERYASMDSAEAWKRELDNLQMAYVSPLGLRLASTNVGTFVTIIHVSDHAAPIIRSLGQPVVRTYVVKDTLLSGRT